MTTRVRVGPHADAVRPGEAWLDAARRLGGPSVVPVDLSGEVKVFARDPDTRVAVRDAVPGDLRDLLSWLAEDEVRRWWPVAAPEATYAARLAGTDPVRVSVVEVNGRSVGFVQEQPAHEGVVGIDYAWGANGRGRGLGARVLWAWLARTHAPTVHAAPDHRNAASRRVLLKAGFTEGLWYDEPQRDGTTTTVVGHTLDLATALGRRGR